MNLEKYSEPYNFQKFENNIYLKWKKSGFFKPENCPQKNSNDFFSLILPPPNVTGTLHCGHALILTLGDLLTRFHRMQGYQSLWLPGADSAALATQSKVEKELAKNKIRKSDLKEEEFYKIINDFANDSKDTIINQIEKMGSSVDWDRFLYTLDENHTLAVNTAFEKLWQDKLIEKDYKIINWDTKLQTALSNEEVNYQEEKTNFYYLKYGPFTIATARPETKFGDKYIVVHPDDKRYKNFEHRQKIKLNWILGPIIATVIKDEVIDMNFGTGAMTITPFHDETDFEIAKRHNLDYEQIIDFSGKLTKATGCFAGLKILEARKKIIQELDKLNLVEKIDSNYIHNISVSERSGAIIEPQLKKQWFIKVNKKFKFPHSNSKIFKFGQIVTLQELALIPIEKNLIQLLPSNFKKNYFEFANNLRDWCISRQIIFGHKIPVWYKGEEILISGDNQKNDGYTRDPDSLDTWFSSSLWTISTLGWPKKTSDLEKFHPNSVLITGYDILFFWVLRMIMMTIYLTGQLPFKTIYLNGLIRDEKGRKMSKSLGNIKDPREMIEKYGNDALRMSLIIGSPVGSDTNLSEEKLKAYRKFTNKVWNIARFVFQNYTKVNYLEIKLTEEDQKLLKNCKKEMLRIQEQITNYQIHLAAEGIYHYIWDTFASNILEESKSILQDNNEKAFSRQSLLLKMFEEILKTLHPFCPFVTEEIWSDFPKENKKLLMIEQFKKN